MGAMASVPAFVGDEVFFRHGAVKSASGCIAVVVGVHVIEILDFALADVAVLADEIAVFGRDRQVMRGSAVVSA